MFNFKAPRTGSDLILKEQAPFDSYTRETVTVTLTATQGLTLGTPLKRAKGVGGAKFVPVTAAADLVDTNEIAFYLADTLGQVRDIAKGTAGDVQVAAIVRGEIILKDKAIKDALVAGGVTLTDVQFGTLKELARLQHIVVEKVLA